MRLMANTKTCAERAHQLIAELWRWRADAESTSPGELGSTKCFGPLGEHEQLALEGFTAGDRPDPGRR
jgi:hypothetical protein